MGLVLPNLNGVDVNGAREEEAADDKVDGLAWAAMELQCKRYPTYATKVRSCVRRSNGEDDGMQRQRILSFGRLLE